MNPIATAGALLMLCPLVCLAQAEGPHRLALVIGNRGYASLPEAPSALAEARLMKTALANVGFTVTLKENVNNDDFFAIESDFLQTVQPGDVCVFYFSGHAAQIVGDDDYLLPVDFPPDSNKEMENRAFRLKRLIEDLDLKKASLKILIVEAPHKIPTVIKGAPAIGLGMPNIRKWEGTLVALAAGAGHVIVATPKPGDIGLFTRSLADRLPRPGLKLPDLFYEAKQEVGKKTNQQQLPDWNDSVLPDGFYFTAPVPVKVPEPTPPPAPTVVVQPVYVSTTVPTSKVDRLEYVHIPPGSFNMGCVPSDTRCDTNEKPPHRVTISKGFWMGRTEVEVAAYQRFVGESGKKYKMPGSVQYNKGWKTTNLPMMMVTWEEASAYCGWAGGRLPTEAEWEYAARGGTKDDQIYPWTGDNIRDKANFDGTSGNDKYPWLAPVHSFDENPFHLYDMAGNVWEWVSDFYSPTYYRVSPEVDPKGPETGKEHVKRGGSFESDWKKDLRISVRESQGTNYLHKVGFRCVLDETDHTKQILNLP
jgi:formylglycine-generating enzyme required for sulfatase activity